MWIDIVKDYNEDEPLVESFAYMNVSRITVQELRESIGRIKIKLKKIR